MSSAPIRPTPPSDSQPGAQHGAPPVPMVDAFDDDRAAGRVVGTTNAAGAVRRGRDAEGQIAIDNHALRLQPLLKPGWGRQGVVFGPYRRAAGLTFALSIINGHNTSQSGMPDPFRGRVRQWLIGSQSEPPARRLIAWLRSRQKRGIVRRLRWWLTGEAAIEFEENLALGWFDSETPQDPLREGAAFIVHAAYGENGELWARVCDRPLTAFRRLQNLQIYYIVVLRERGAAYYVSSLAHAHGTAAFPTMRPIAIEPWHDAAQLYAGFYQCVLGQIGFRVDTRVQAVNVVQAEEMVAWYGSAHAADALIGKGGLDGAAAEVGGRWRAIGGGLTLTARGARPEEAGVLAVLDPGVPSGLVHALLEPTDAVEAAVGLVWRLRDERSYWMLRLSHAGCELLLVEAGAPSVVAQDAAHGLPRAAVCSVQILDGHGQFGLYLDGVRLFDRWFTDTRLEGATGLGFRAEQAGGPLVRAFEAHPASVPIPSSIPFEPPWDRTGGRVVVADSFAGAADDLAGHVGEQGGRAWQKILGKGALELTGERAARVRATVEAPNPGRLAYVVDWPDAGFADVETTVVPPGSARGQGQHCRGGLIFWQDPRNYLTFTPWLHDVYQGASVALFPYLTGYEELYDAIWTMVWTKIDWGTPFRLRVVFDGARFTVSLGGEPVLHRALTDLYPHQPPLRINRLGLAVNWEWGDDTGSSFKDFVARA